LNKVELNSSSKVSIEGGGERQESEPRDDLAASEKPIVGILKKQLRSKHSGF
jgi:hypothetical protein